MTPGNYLVEFWIDHYSVDTLVVTVPVDGPATIEAKLTAYPRYQLKGLWHAPGQLVRSIDIELGIPYRDATIDEAGRE